MPDDTSGVDEQLTLIASLVAAHVTPVDYASVTANRSGAPTTVAVSNELALAVDEAQYADHAGPCLDALDTGTPVAVDIATTLSWPGFRRTASDLGLQASLSIPLFAGSGAPLAALNLYAYDRDALAPLSAALLHTFDVYREGRYDTGDMPTVNGQHDAGSNELLAGLSQAFAIQHRINFAIGVLMQRHNIIAEAAYLALREQAADTGRSLLETAATVVSTLS
jgi:hypothetical protein